MSEQQGLAFEDYEILEMPFGEDDLGNKGKEVYIYRSAIMERLKLIDPNYEDYIEPRTEVENDTVTVWGSLTLNGVTRWNSASAVIQCWRKESNGSYTRFGDYEYSKALANAKMSAATGLLQRCAAKFGVGIELKERAAKAAKAARKGQNPPPTGQRPTQQQPSTSKSPAPGAPSDPPPHWALNGDGKKISARMNQLGLTWDDLKSALEPGKVLAKLSDTTLTYEAVYHKMDEIKTAKVAADLEAKRNAQPAPQKGNEPISVKCTELRAGDLVYGLNGRNGKPARLMHYLGDTPDGIFAEWIVWSQTQFTNVTRLPFDKTFSFKIRRDDNLAEPPEMVLKEVEYLKGQHAAFNAAPQDATT